MVGSTGVMTMRLIRSKIRKREDSSVVDTVNVETPLPHQRHTNHHHHHHSSNQQYHQNLQQQYQNGKTASDHPQNNNNNCNQTNNNNSGVWVFPPLPPQPNIYSVNHLALMQANNDHKNGFKGLKRQLSGRFKRMISRKPNEPPTPTIPPELKPQLKTIYVY